MRWQFASALLAAGLWAGQVGAGPEPVPEAAHHDGHAGPEYEYKIEPEHPEHTMQRAGYPDTISCLAKPSVTCEYVGYYVGGGNPFHRGDGPGPCEGTWGWDYSGCWFQRNVILNWWHGRCYQGGRGAYYTDGPRVFHHGDGNCGGN